MKKFFEGIFAILAVIFVPAVFIAALWFALSQSFGVGITIVITSLIIQIILSRKNRELFGWKEYDGFNFKDSEVEERRCKILNILFNATKVATVLGIFGLIYFNYFDILHLFDETEITISICWGIIFILLISLNKRIGSYQKVRASLATIVLITIVSFACFTFGTQLIWLSLVALIIFGVLAGTRELDKILKTEDNNLIFFLSVIIFITAIVSTIIQFWPNTVACDSTEVLLDFSAIGHFIVKIFSYELIPGSSVLFIVLSAFVVIGLLILARYFKKREEAKNEAKYKESQKRADERKKEEEREAKELLEKERIQKYNDTIKDISTRIQGRSLDSDQLAYVALASKSVYVLNAFSMDKFTGVPLQNFLIISKLKKKIVWKESFNNILDLYAVLYSRSYNDDNLSLIIERIEELSEFLEQYQDFDGYSAFLKKIKETGIPVSNA